MDTPTMQQRIESLIEQLQASLPDADRFDRGQNAAGIRIRKLAQDVKVECQAIRKDIQTIRDSRKNS